MQSSRISQRASLACAIAVVVVACTPRGAEPPTPLAADEPEREVIATVDGEAVPLDRFNLLFAARLRGTGHRLTTRATYLETKRAIARDMVNELLVRQGAKRRGVTVSAEEVTARRTALAATFKTPEQFKQHVANYPQQDVGLRRSLETQLLEEKLAGVKDEPVSEEHARIFYTRNNARYQTPAYLTAEEILFARGARAKADEVAKLARDPKLSFAALARTYSKSPRARLGGDMGRVEEKSVDPAVWKALRGLKPGEVSSVVESADGLRLLRLVRLNPAVNVSFETARPEIERSLRARRRSAAIADLRAALLKEATVDNAFERRHAEDFALHKGTNGGLGEIATLPAVSPSAKPSAPAARP